jgi:tetratricopeptide (TPR) repeat protein
LSGRRTSIRTTGDLLDRYARTLIEEGQFEKALEFCKKAEEHHVGAHDSMEITFRERLLLDYADALSALGREKEAAKYWENVITQGERDSLAYLIAKARKLSASYEARDQRGQLEEVLQKSQEDPAAGELRRRALWTLKVLAHSERN